MNRLALFAVGGLIVTSCTTTQPAAKPEPAASVSAAISADAGPPPLDLSNGWPKAWPTKWNDPNVVAALEQKCDYVPSDRPDYENLQRPPDLFRCVVGVQQACNPDPCFRATDVCDAECTTSCNGCRGTCAKSCESCKAGCKDATCTHQCAVSCADCNQACTTTLDHCTTADCGKKHADCSKELRTRYKANGCSAKCTRWKACEKSCGSLPSPGECVQKCETALSPGWKACNAKCDLLSMDPDRKPYAACLGDCYLSVPCAPFVCETGTGE